MIGITEMQTQARDRYAWLVAWAVCMCVLIAMGNLALQLCHVLTCLNLLQNIANAFPAAVDVIEDILLEKDDSNGD